MDFSDFAIQAKYRKILLDILEVNGQNIGHPLAPPPPQTDFKCNSPLLEEMLKEMLADTQKWISSLRVLVVLLL